MTGQVGGTVKNARSQRLIEKADAASQQFFEKCTGAVRRVLFEELTEDGLLTGYSDNYVKVYAMGTPEMLNQFYWVKLLEPYQDGMKGEIENG